MFVYVFVFIIEKCLKYKNQTKMLPVLLLESIVIGDFHLLHYFYII